MFHGYYEQYQYLPIAFTCAENDMVLLVGLRHGTCDAFLGVDNDLRYLMGRLRAVWPDVHVHVRARQRPGRAPDVRRLPGTEALLHLRDRRECPAPGPERRPDERGPRRVQEDR